MNMAVKNKVSLASFVLVLLGILFLTGIMVWPFLLSVLTGGILSILSKPLYNFLRSKGLGPRLSSALTVLALVILIIGPAATFFTVAFKQGIAVARDLASRDFSFDAWLDRTGRLGFLRTFFPDPGDWQAQAREFLENTAKTVSGVVLAQLQNIPNLLLQLALALIAQFFFLIDGERFVNWTLQKVLMDADVRDSLKSTFQDTSASVVWATLAASSSQALVVFLAYIILGIPSAFLAGGLTFIFTWIPMVGSLPTVAAGCIYLFLKGSISKVIVMVVFGLATGIVDNFVRPLVLKGRSDMHPLVSLVAIFGGISFFGMLGVFVGPILAAVLISMIQVWPLVASRLGIPLETTNEIVSADGNGPVVPPGEMTKPEALAELKRIKSQQD